MTTIFTEHCSDLCFGGNGVAAAAVHMGKRSFGGASGGVPKRTRSDVLVMHGDKTFRVTTHRECAERRQEVNERQTTGVCFHRCTCGTCVNTPCERCGQTIDVSMVAPLDVTASSENDAKDVAENKKRGDDVRRNVVRNRDLDDMVARRRVEHKDPVIRRRVRAYEAQKERENAARRQAQYERALLCAEQQRGCNDKDDDDDGAPVRMCADMYLARAVDTLRRSVAPDLLVEAPRREDALDPTFGNSSAYDQPPVAHGVVVPFDGRRAQRGGELPPKRHEFTQAATGARETGFDQYQRLLLERSAERAMRLPRDQTRAEGLGATSAHVRAALERGRVLVLNRRGVRVSMRLGTGAECQHLLDLVRSPPPGR